jgi:hypothetical protein
VTTQQPVERIAVTALSSGNEVAVVGIHGPQPFSALRA